MLESVTELRTRPLTYLDGVVDPVDLAHATRLVLDSELAVLGRHDTTQDDVAAMLAVPSMDREHSCFVLDGDDVVGLMWIDVDPFEHVTGFELFTLPWPGTEDLRSSLCAMGLEQARARRASGGPQWKARAGCYVDDTAYAEVMRGAGMSPVRRFYRMSIDSTSPEIPDVAPPLPPGVAIVPGAADEAARRIVHQIDRDSFSEHWGWADYPFDDWWQHMSTAPSFDPDDWWLLTVDGAPAGICLLGNGRAALGEGYVQVLGVLKEFRGRGLAQLLLRRAFVHYRDLGRSATLLGVDATNTTGAVALYEKVGMRPVLVMEAYEHPLD
jgi:ribosomal protein S18 acetylase RimI-like enzyme